MAAVQADDDDDEQYLIFGDSAYKTQSHIRSYFKRMEMLPEYKTWNYKMKSVRESIEWNYGYTGALFRYVRTKRKLQVLKGVTVTKVYIVATILRNCYIAKYGGQTSNYFNLEIHDDFLYNYVNQIDFD